MLAGVANEPHEDKRIKKKTQYRRLNYSITS